MPLWRRLGLLLGLLALPQAAGAANACRLVIERAAPPVNACYGADTISIAAVGDVLLHRPLQARGYRDPKDGFRDIWRAAEPFLARADIAYANLEGPVAPGITKGRGQTADPGPVFDDRVYSSYPLFNYHPVVIGQLKASGIDIVSTANNHAMDRGSVGADLTVANLRAQGMPFTGTIARGEPRAFVTYTPSKLGQIAWIACSYSTNGISDPGNQVLMCYDDSAELLALIAREAHRPQVAAVIVTPHWGWEYQHNPNSNQRQLAAQMAAAGATAILGTHPHVVQPWDWLAGPAGTRTLVVYSTGNFVSGQVRLPRRTGVMAWVELCRPPPSADLARALKSRLVVARAGWLPLVMGRDANGPALGIAGRASKGLLADARKLVERYLGAPGITLDIDCGPPRRTADAVALQ